MSQEGRVAVVTGVGRRAGIGFAIVERLLADGARVLIQSWSPYDVAMPWGGEPGGSGAVLDALGSTGPTGPTGPPGPPGPPVAVGGASGRLHHLEADFADPAAPARVIASATERFGAVDILIACHARSAWGTLETVTADELDLAWAVNARASLLLAQAFAAAHDDARPHGRVLLFTSGQHLGPMPDELPYAVSKGAIHQMTRSLADALADRGITVNAINPGPVDTGWATPELREQLRAAFPARRWGRPSDIASVVAWLVSPDSAWVTGQVIDAEGGFRRWR